MNTETDHTIRTALVCLLAAGVAGTGLAAVVGDQVGGCFWLPPWPLWSPWA